MAPLLVLYDEDCGFCRWSADRLRAWARRSDGGTAVAWIGRRWPRLAELVYGAVASRRDRLGAVLGAETCAVDPAGAA